MYLVVEPHYSDNGVRQQGQAQLAGLAGDLGLTLPNSRTQETEADLMGLELMARAGYDPNAAIILWKKMQSVEGRGEPPQFLSTHPWVKDNFTAWQYMRIKLIKSNELNAHVLPGGKIIFYSGIIDRLSLTDAEIAAIMGHEMAHALREHARERISRQVATQTGIGIAASVLGLSQGQAQLAGLAGDLGLTLPNSRTQETEADLMGLELMARAGYDPNAAIILWKKMQSVEGRGEPPQFLSTHPVSSNRIANLQAMVPKVTPLYQQSKYR